MIYLDAHGTLSGTLQDKVWETAVQDKAVMLVPQNKNSDSEEHENVHMLTGLWHHLPEYPQVPCCPWWFHLSDHSEKDRGQCIQSRSSGGSQMQLSLCSTIVLTLLTFSSFIAMQPQGQHRKDVYIGQQRTQTFLLGRFQIRNLIMISDKNIQPRKFRLCQQLLDVFHSISLLSKKTNCTSIGGPFI